jgi:hypothetical protein
MMDDLGMSGGVLYGEPMLYDSATSVYGNGSVGRIHIEGTYTGTASSPTVE